MDTIFVTDLDGTLLDHDSYSYAAAQPALDALAAAGIPLVLATSKTAAEVRPLHAALNLGDTPAIVENGAGIIDGAETVEEFSTYTRIRAALDAMPEELRAGFTGFGDLGDRGVVRETGLPLDAAILARRRAYSEPGIWSGTETKLAKFCDHLAAIGITAQQGGRFLTLSEGRTKAEALRAVARRLKAKHVVALGDAPNDAAMLEAADTGIIVRNEHGTPLPPLAGEDEGRILRTVLTGPAGWNAAVLELLGKSDATGKQVS